MLQFLIQLIAELIVSRGVGDRGHGFDDGPKRLRKYAEHEVPRERQLIRSFECPACAGVGHAPCSPIQCRIECERCGGSGQRACARCEGSGFAQQRVA